VVCKGITLQGLKDHKYNRANADEAKRKVQEMEKVQLEPISKSCHWVEDVEGEEKPNWLVIYAGK